MDWTIAAVWKFLVLWLWSEFVVSGHDGPFNVAVAGNPWGWSTQRNIDIHGILHDVLHLVAGVVSRSLLLGITLENTR